MARQGLVANYNTKFQADSTFIQIIQETNFRFTKQSA